MICPKPVTLGFHLTPPPQEQSKEFLTWVISYPLKSLVQTLYCLPKVLYWFQHSHVSKDTFMRDICGGNYVKTILVLCKSFYMMMILKL